MALRPVNSEKHEVSWSLLGLNNSTTNQQEIVIGTTSGNVTASNQVPVGATVRWIYFEFNFSAETITNTKIIHWSVNKRPFNTATTAPNSYNGQDKRFLLKRGMEMLPKSVNTIIKRIFVVKIPPRLRRIGASDRINFQFITTSAETINACGIAIYKHLE